MAATTANGAHKIRIKKCTSTQSSDCLSAGFNLRRFELSDENGWIGRLVAMDFMDNAFYCCGLFSLVGVFLHFLFCFAVCVVSATRRMLMDVQREVADVYKSSWAKTK